MCIAHIALCVPDNCVSSLTHGRIGITEKVFLRASRQISYCDKYYCRWVVVTELDVILKASWLGYLWFVFIDFLEIELIKASHVAVSFFWEIGNRLRSAGKHAALIPSRVEDFHFVANDRQAYSQNTTRWNMGCVTANSKRCDTVIPLRDKPLRWCSVERMFYSTGDSQPVNMRVFRGAHI